MHVWLETRTALHPRLPRRSSVTRLHTSSGHYPGTLASPSDVQDLRAARSARASRSHVTRRTREAPAPHPAFVPPHIVPAPFVAFPTGCTHRYVSAPLHATSTAPCTSRAALATFPRRAPFTRSCSTAPRRSASPLRVSGPLQASAAPCAASVLRIRTA